MTKNYTLVVRSMHDILHDIQESISHVSDKLRQQITSKKTVSTKDLSDLVLLIKTIREYSAESDLMTDRAVKGLLDSAASRREFLQFIRKNLTKEEVRMLTKEEVKMLTTNGEDNEQK